VVAERADVEMHQVDRVDRRAVVEVRRDQRRRSDHVERNLAVFAAGLLRVIANCLELGADVVRVTNRGLREGRDVSASVARQVPELRYAEAAARRERHGAVASDKAHASRDASERGFRKSRKAQLEG
jgi:hypothetical protein